MMNNIIVIFCLPYSKFPVNPDDTSEAELVDCPICNHKMWFSDKKRRCKEMAEELQKEIIFECYDCFEKRINKEDSRFDQMAEIHISENIHDFINNYCRG